MNGNEDHSASESNLKIAPSAKTPDRIGEIRLRDVCGDDLPKLYDFQFDPDANRMAFTHPRNRDAFDVHWEKSLADQSVVVKAIMVGDDLAGCISCFKADGQDSIGYWIGKEYWGHGIATQGLQMLLKEVSVRPLHARVAVANIASIRVLQKCGFDIVGQEHTPASDRYKKCEEAILELK